MEYHYKLLELEDLKIKIYDASDQEAYPTLGNGVLRGVDEIAIIFSLNISGDLLYNEWKEGKIL